MAIVLSKSLSNCLDQVQDACTAIEEGKLCEAGTLLCSLRNDAKNLQIECEKYHLRLEESGKKKQKEIEEITSKINNLFEEENNLQKQKTELCVKKTALKGQKQTEENHLREAQRSYNQAEKNQQDAQEEVDKLKRWWWVPVYGPSLLVREFVEDYSGQAQKAANDMEGYKQRSNDAQKQIKSLGNQGNQVENAIKSKTKRISNLKEQRANLRSKVGSTKKASRLFREAATFWEILADLSDNANTNTVQLQKTYNFVSKIKLSSKIEDILNSKGTKRHLESFRGCWLDIMNTMRNSEFNIFEEILQIENKYRL